jgi:hypothetical protein
VVGDLDAEVHLGDQVTRVGAHAKVLEEPSERRFSASLVRMRTVPFIFEGGSPTSARELPRRSFRVRIGCAACRRPRWARRSHCR